MPRVTDLLKKFKGVINEDDDLDLDDNDNDNEDFNVKLENISDTFEKKVFC
jgi:hypothetical protein